MWLNQKVAKLLRWYLIICSSDEFYFHPGPFALPFRRRDSLRLWCKSKLNRKNWNTMILLTKVLPTSRPTVEFDVLIVLLHSSWCLLSLVLCTGHRFILNLRLTGFSVSFLYVFIYFSAMCPRKSGQTRINKNSLNLSYCYIWHRCLIRAPVFEIYFYIKKVEHGKEKFMQYRNRLQFFQQQNWNQKYASINIRYQYILHFELPTLLL